jgi:predicted transcriptional regulator
MMFIATDLETQLVYLSQLTATTKPTWGTMTAQRMVEHLTDTLRIATGKNPQQLAIPEEKLPSMLRFLESDKEMAPNIAVDFATPDMKERNEELELAIDEFVDEWLAFEELFSEQANHTAIHPFYGPLNGEQWMRLSQKHHTHHFKQFGLIKSGEL